MERKDYEYKKTKYELQCERLAKALRFKGLIFCSKALLFVWLGGLLITALIMFSPTGPIGSTLIEECRNSPALCALIGLPILGVLTILYYIIKFSLAMKINDLENQEDMENERKIDRIREIDGREKTYASGVINDKECVTPDDVADDPNAYNGLSIVQLLIAGASILVGVGMVKKVVEKLRK